MSLTAKNASTSRPPWDRFANYHDNPYLWGPRTYVALWDDTTDGHILLAAAAGLGLGVFIPPNFIVTRVDIDVLVVPVGPTNMSASLENDGDLVTAAAISGAPWSTTGVKTGAQVGVPGTSYTSAATAFNVAPIRTTVTREVAIGGTIANSSAGRVALFITGQQSFTLVQGGTQ